MSSSSHIDRWVNARVTITIPMEGVTPESATEAKSDALTEMMDSIECGLPAVWFGVRGAVMSGTWEDAEIEVPT